MVGTKPQVETALRRFTWETALRRFTPRDLAPAVVQVRACRVDTGALCYQAKLVRFE